MHENQLEQQPYFSKGVNSGPLEPSVDGEIGSDGCTREEGGSRARGKDHTAEEVDKGVTASLDVSTSFLSSIPTVRGPYLITPSVTFGFAALCHWCGGPGIGAGTGAGTGTGTGTYTGIGTGMGMGTVAGTGAGTDNCP